MALTIFQVNICSWKNNNYILKCSLPQTNPDIILLNEISITEHCKINIRGYRGIHKCTEQKSGVAIFVKYNLQAKFIEFNSEDILAVKITTNLGQLLVATVYTPPRRDYIPTIQINKILDFKLPTVIIGDFNANHMMFDNSTHSNNKGKQLFTLINSKNLRYLGPHSIRISKVNAKENLT